MSVVWQPGEVKVIPGVYIRELNVGGVPAAGAGTEAVACVFQASSGPLGTVVDVAGALEVNAVYGTGGGTDAPREALRGGALVTRCVRVGTGGTPGSLDLEDSTPVTPVAAVTLETAGPGTRAFSVVVRDSLGDPARRELLVYEENADATLTLVQTISFAAGGTTPGEPQALVDAVTAAGGYLVASKIADGNMILADVAVPAPLTGGADPTVAASDYTTAFALLATADDWSIVVSDSDDAAVHAASAEFVLSRRNAGARVRGFVAEPPSVPFDDRLTDAAALGVPYMCYWGNGFVGSDGLVREGWRMAARAAGQTCSVPVTQAITSLPIAGAVDVQGAVSDQDQVRAANGGMNVLVRNPRRQIVYQNDLTTLLAPTQTLDEGWKSLRRARERDMLVTRIYRSWAPLTGQVSNTVRGRNTLLSVANGVCEDMVNEEAFYYARTYEDPQRPPAGNYAYFICEGLDVDSLEVIYISFYWSFAGPLGGAAAAQAPG